MKAVVIARPGGAEVLEVREVEDPAVGDDEVLIKVEAAALNRADTLQRMGLHPPPAGASPYPGLECSGTILALGRSVVGSRWKIGDRVRTTASLFPLPSSLFPLRSIVINLISRYSDDLCW